MVNGEVKYIRIPGGCYALPFILSFGSKEGWVDHFIESYFLHIDGKDRKALAESIYKEAKRIEKADKKSEKTEEQSTTE